MQLQITKSKNAESFYIIKSYRDKQSGKTTSKVVEKLGTRAELEAKLGKGVDVVAWGKQRAKELTAKEKESRHKVMVGYDPTRQLERGRRRVFCGGYLFLQSIYFELGLSAIAHDIQERSNFSYDLDAILSRLIYGRILHPSSKVATYEFSKGLLEAPSFEAHQVYRALEVLHRENDFIQAALYKNSAKVVERKTKILYFDCTNFYFEIEEDDEFRRYGASKQHQPLPLVQMGLFMDSEGMPLAFSMDNGAKNEQLTLRPLEEKILEDFELSEFVVVTDAGLSSTANRRFNSRNARQFITTQSIKKLKAHLKSWALDEGGWSLGGADGLFNLNEVRAEIEKAGKGSLIRKALFDKTFYKSRRIKEKDAATGEDFEQTLIVTFSFKYEAYQASIRQDQIDRAIKAIASSSSRLDKKNQNDYRRFVKKAAHTKHGEACEHTTFSIDEEVIANEALFDGYYGLCTSLDGDDVEGICKVSARRWEIEECFRIMKTELKARPAYLSREERIRAHFLTCFIALLVYRILEKKLGGTFTVSQILDTLKAMDFEEVKGEGYRPLYERSEITDALHEVFGFQTDFEIITNRDMKKIFKKTKQR